MIFFIFLMVVSYVVLSIGLGFSYGPRFGEKSLRPNANSWKLFGVGAAKIFGFHFALGLGWQVLFGLLDQFLISFGMLILSCIVAAIYAAVIWLPIYALCFWGARRSGLKAMQG